jgi:hypothetical protein
MSSLPLSRALRETVMVNRESLFEKVSLAVARPRQELQQARADMVKEY